MTLPLTVNWESSLQVWVEKPEVNERGKGWIGKQHGWPLFKVWLCLRYTVTGPHTVAPASHVCQLLGLAASVMGGWALVVGSTHSESTEDNRFGGRWPVRIYLGMIPMVSPVSRTSKGAKRSYSFMLVSSQVLSKRGVVSTKRKKILSTLLKMWGNGSAEFPHTRPPMQRQERHSWFLFNRYLGLEGLRLWGL